MDTTVPKQAAPTGCLLRWTLQDFFFFFTSKFTNVSTSGFLGVPEIFCGTKEKKRPVIVGKMFLLFHLLVNVS